MKCLFRYHHRHARQGSALRRIPRRHSSLRGESFRRTSSSSSSSSRSSLWDLVVEPKGKSLGSDALLGISESMAWIANHFWIHLDTLIQLAVGMNLCLFLWQAAGFLVLILTLACMLQSWILVLQQQRLEDFREMRCIQRKLRAQVNHFQWDNHSLQAKNVALLKKIHLLEQQLVQEATVATIESTENDDDEQAVELAKNSKQLQQQHQQIIHCMAE